MMIRDRLERWWVLTTRGAMIAALVGSVALVGAVYGGLVTR